MAVYPPIKKNIFSRLSLKPAEVGFIALAAIFGVFIFNQLNKSPNLYDPDVLPVEDSRSAPSVEILKPDPTSHPLDRYITNTGHNNDLVKLSRKLETTNTSTQSIAELQTLLKPFKLDVSEAANGQFGSESKGFANADLNELKIFEMLFMDEIYKYPNSFFKVTSLQKIKFSNGALGFGSRSSLAGLAQYSSNSIIYDVTSINYKLRDNPAVEKLYIGYARFVIQHEVGHYTHAALGMYNSNYPSSWGNWSQLNPPGFKYNMSCDSVNPSFSNKAPEQGFVDANSVSCPTEDWADVYATNMKTTTAFTPLPTDEYFKSKQKYIKDRLTSFSPIFKQVFAN